MCWEYTECSNVRGGPMNRDVGGGRNERDKCESLSFVVMWKYSYFSFSLIKYIMEFELLGDSLSELFLNIDT